MNLSSTQKTALKTHLLANTNQIQVQSDPAVAINASPGVLAHDPTYQQAIADWYNSPATAGDAQPFANLMLWNPKTTIRQLNGAVNWVVPPFGADQPTITNSWMMWQSMTWDQINGIDMTDPQVRQGVLTVWAGTLTPAAGQSYSPTLANIGAINALGNGGLCGKIAGRRIELVLSPLPVGAVTNAWAAAHVCPSNALGVTLLATDIDGALG